MKSATTTPRNRGGGKTASRIWSWTVDVWALVRGHRSNPIFHPISHPRLRSIRFPRFPRGHRLPPSPPLSRGEKREIAALSTSTGQKAREIDLISFSTKFQPSPPPPSTSSLDLLSFVHREISIRSRSVHDFDRFVSMARNYIRGNVSCSSDYSEYFLIYQVIG